MSALLFEHGHIFPSLVMFAFCLQDLIMCVVPDTGLAFDSWDLDYYTSMFQRIERNPTSVECFDLAQSNRCGFTAASTLTGLLCVVHVALLCNFCCCVFHSVIFPLYPGVPASTVATGSSGGGWRSMGRNRRRLSSD